MLVQEKDPLALPQYSLEKILLVWAAAAVPMGYWDGLLLQY
jgi:hypothetical protein